jgi:hypothetical protein
MRDRNLGIRVTLMQETRPDPNPLPSMEAGVTDRLWEIEDILSLM